MNIFKDTTFVVLIASVIGAIITLELKKGTVLFKFYKAMVMITISFILTPAFCEYFEITSINYIGVVALILSGSGYEVVDLIRKKLVEYINLKLKNYDSK